MPWLGAIAGSAAGSAMRRTSSLKGPVALITTRARAVEVLAGFEIAERATPSRRDRP